MEERWVGRRGRPRGQTESGSRPRDATRSPVQADWHAALITLSTSLAPVHNINKLLRHQTERIPLATEITATIGDQQRALIQSEPRA
jgi:hypothetical protein